MKINDDEMLEFKTEAFELIDHAEKSLLSLEEGAEFSVEYNSIFRAFHCIKGSAGMLDLVPLQTHMHHLETTLNKYKDSGNMPKEVIDHLLKGCDSARNLFSEEALLLADPEPPSAVIPETTVVVHQDQSKATIELVPAFSSANDGETAKQALYLLLQLLPDLDSYYEQCGRELERDVLQRKVFDLMRNLKNAG